MLKKIFRSFLNVLFISTAITLVAATTSAVLLKPDRVKFWVQKSGVYANLPNSIINQSAPEQIEAPSDISLANPIIASAAKSSLTSDFIQKSSEQIINDIFVWLKGGTSTPEFSIDLLPIKQTFADKIVAATKERYNKLPDCTFGTFPKSSNPLTIECRPIIGVDINKATEDLRAEILNNKEFLPDGTLTSANLLGTSDPNSVFASKIGPNTYQSLQLAPFVLVVLLLIYAGGIIVLSKSKRDGLNRVGVLLVLSGMLATVSTWLATLGYGHYQDKLQIIGIKTFADIAMPVIDVFRYDALKYTGIVSSILSTVGIVVLVILAILKKRVKKTTPAFKVPASKVVEKPVIVRPLDAKPSKPKPTPKIKIIQPKQQSSLTVISLTPSTAPEVITPSKKLIQ